MNPLSQNKAWSYVGRFITNFAMIENKVNELFHALLCISYNQPAGAVAVDTWITMILDLRKKLELIDIILQRRGVDESKTFKRVHELHDLRNVISHFPFEEEFEGELHCDYLYRVPLIRTRAPIGAIRGT
jgi:hypothetical protein